MNCSALAICRFCCDVQRRRAERRAIRDGFGIQVGALGSQVAQLDEKRAAQVLLYAHVPALRVADLVVLLDRVSVQDGWRWWGR